MDSLPAMAPLRAAAVNRELAILVLIVGVCAAPFLGQPFHIDDGFYMDMARNAREKPLFPNDMAYVFMGQSLPDMGSHSHPPLQTYFLALMQKCFGEGPGKERIYHSCALIYPVLAVVSFYFLSARFLVRPLWPALALACSPLFMVMQHSFMTDVPALSFWLAAIACFIYASESMRPGLFAASAAFQFAAMFTSYQAASLTLLLGYYQVRRRAGWRGWLALAAPICAMGAWLVMNFLHYRRWILGDTFGYIESRHGDTLEALGRKLGAVLDYQGWLILFPFFFLYIFARGLRGRLFGIALVAATSAAQIFVPRYRLVDKGIFIAGLVTGAFVVLRMAEYAYAAFRAREPDSEPERLAGQVLSLWYFGVLFYCVVILTEGSARYLLPLAPPLLIVFFQSLEALEIREYRARSLPFLSSGMAASGTIVITLAWGLLLSHADFEFARIYPKAALEISRITGGMDSYYAGEWGFRYYFAQAGFAQMPPDESRVRGGNWLVRPKLALPYDIPAALDSMTMPIQAFSYDLNTPLRLLDWRTPAAFYSTGWGLLPFSFSYRALEEVEVRQVNYLVEQLPRARIEAAEITPPWPGYLELQGKNHLAVLARPNTRITYPWLPRAPLLLELKCGIGMESYEEDKSRVFRFDVRQTDLAGAILASFSQALNPGLRKEDRRWQPVRVLLQGSDRAPTVLEISFACDEKGAGGMGAFAEALLRKP